MIWGGHDMWSRPFARKMKRLPLGISRPLLVTSGAVPASVSHFSHVVEAGGGLSISAGGVLSLNYARCACRR